ncbi:hypothetical protein CC79DRAFT_1277307 [Sarocladium strictum]
MVHIIEERVETLTAYVTTELTAAELDDFKSRFESGACSRFCPLLHVKLVRAPQDYIGQSIQHIRTKEDAAGRGEPFLVIDEEARKRGGIWFIESFALEDNVEMGTAASTDVVLKALYKPEVVALAAVNFLGANMGIEEDIEGCGVELPLTNESVQPELIGEDYPDVRDEQDAVVIAEPGEFETTTSKATIDGLGMMPVPKKVGRLTEEVARANGFVNDWTRVEKPEPIELPKGAKKYFPKESVALQLKYDPEHPWPVYTWPEGSL